MPHNLKTRLSRPRGEGGVGSGDGRAHRSEASRADPDLRVRSPPPRRSAYLVAVADDRNPPARTLLALEAIGFAYPGSARTPRVIDAVTASFRAGTLTALLGPNAAGKSTLLRLALGLLTPHAGRVTIATAHDAARPDVRSLPPAERARHLSYVPQRPSVAFAYRVRQVVAMGAYAAGEAGRDPRARDRINAALADLQLTDVAERPFDQLSGGQQQRVVMARAMVQACPDTTDSPDDRATLGGGSRPHVMLLDEPVSAMDLAHQHATLGLLRRWVADDAASRAAVIVLHDLNLAMQYADTAMLLDSGRVAQQGPWAEVLDPAVLEPVYNVRFARWQPEGFCRPAFAVTPLPPTTT